MWELLVVLLLALLAAFYAWHVSKVSALRAKIQEEAKRLFDQWRETELATLRQNYESQVKSLQEQYARQLAEAEEQYKRRAKELEEQYLRQLEEAKRLYAQEAESAKAQALKEAELSLQEWLRQNEARIREDAIRRSVRTILGRVGEQLAPFLVSQRLGADPRDFRFIGSPVDYVVFRGLSNGKVEEVVFLEVKTGRTALTEREREVRRAVEEKKVRWVTVSLREAVEESAKAVEEAVRAAVEEQMRQHQPPATVTEM